MKTEFRLPDLGEGISGAEIRKWLVKEGDAIEEHQDVLEVETDKAVVEIPSPQAGKVLKLHRQEGEEALVGDVLLTIEYGDGKPEEEKPRESVTVIGELPEAEEAEKEVLATPAVRALAREMGIEDLSKIKATGPAGSITREDVLKFTKKAFKQATDEYGAIERIPIKGIRKTIAKNMMQAQRSTAFVTGMDEADITELWDLREREKTYLKGRGLHLTFLPFIIKAVQHAIKEHPMLNASVDEENGEIIRKKYINIGIAVDTPEGLMVPVIKDVEKKTIVELSQELQELSEKARIRKIGLEDLKGNSFTITNYGIFGGLFATPIINPPDTAILGAGRIAERPWVRRDGAEQPARIEIRRILPLSLTFDHRATDGADAARFLTKVLRYLENPALIFVESA